MSDDPRTRAATLAQKLARVAAPNSGATEAERANATAELLKIMSQHDLTIVVPEPVKKQRRPRPQQPSPVHTPYYSPFDPSEYAPPPYTPPQYPRYSTYSGSNWTEVTVGSACKCGACGAVLHAGYPAFHDPSQGYRCYDITCTDNT